MTDRRSIITMDFWFGKNYSVLLSGRIRDQENSIYKWELLFLAYLYSFMLRQWLDAFEIQSIYPETFFFSSFSSSPDKNKKRKRLFHHWVWSKQASAVNVIRLFYFLGQYAHFSSIKQVSEWLFSFLFLMSMWQDLLSFPFYF